MNQTELKEAAASLTFIARRLERYSRNIEIEWDGMQEIVTYADKPLETVLMHTAQDIRAIAEALKDGQDEADA